MEKKDFGAKLLLLRKEKGVSQADVAEYIGLTVAAYQNYENGRREAGYDTISKLADFYGVTTDYLLGRDSQNDLTPSQKEEIALKKWLSLDEEKRAAVLQMMESCIKAYEAADANNQKEDEA